MKAKVFRESSGPWLEVYKKFGILECSLCRFIAEDRGCGQLGQPSYLPEVIPQLHKEVKIATENKISTPTPELARHTHEISMDMFDKSAWLACGD